MLKKQVILAMWCTSVSEQGQSIAFTLVNDAVKNLTTSVEFKTMVFYLSRWFTAQYVSQMDRTLKVVLDCKQSEGSC